MVERDSLRSGVGNGRSVGLAGSFLVRGASNLDKNNTHAFRPNNLKSWLAHSPQAHDSANRADAATQTLILNLPPLRIPYVDGNTV